MNYLILYFSVNFWHISSLIYTHINDNYQGLGNITLPYLSLDEALAQNYGLENIYYIDNDQILSNPNISLSINLTHNTTIMNYGIKDINMFILADIEIQNIIKFMNLTILLKDSSLKVNGSLIISNCNLTTIYEDNQYHTLIYLYESSFFIFLNSFLYNINSPFIKTIFNVDKFCQLQINNSIFININVNNTEIFLAFEAFIFISNTTFKNIYSDINFPNSQISIFDLSNSQLNMTNFNILSSSSLSIPFLILSNSLSKANSISLINCSFYNLNIFSSDAFISINCNIFTYIRFFNVIFSNITSNALIISITSCTNEIQFLNLTIFQVICQIAIKITNTKIFSLANSLLISNNVNNNAELDSTLIVLDDLQSKNFDTIFIYDCLSYITTPGIKILSTLHIFNYTTTLINNSFFSNNRVYYHKENEGGVVFYIFTDFDNITIQNSYFDSNFIIPYSSDGDQIGSPCMRIAGEDINLTIYRSIFKNNQAVFGSNCIYYDGNVAQINVSLFQNNTNVFPPKDKYILEAYGFGGSIYTIGEALFINNSFFLSNMNYFGGNIYVDGNLLRYNSIVRIDNSVFIDNYAHTFGGALYIANGFKYLTANLSNLLFYRNWGNYNGGGVQVQFSSKAASASFSYLNFIENWADFGPAINFESQISSYYIFNSQFLNNTASFQPRDITKLTFAFPVNGASGGAISSIVKAGFTNLFIYSENNVFIDNNAYAKGGVWVTIGGIYEVRNSLFLRNSAAKSGCFHMHLDSYLYLYNSTIIESSSLVTYSCIMLSDSAYALIENTVFKDCYSNGAGLISVLSNSNLSLIACSFNNISSSYASVLNVKSNGYNLVHLQNNYFNGVLNSFSTEIFYITSSKNIIFSNNLIENFKSRLFTIINSNINFTGGEIIREINCQNTSQDGCIINSLTYSTIFIYEGNFYNIWSASNGIFSMKNSKFLINSSNIMNIYNFNGVAGIIYMHISQIESINNIFSNSFSSFIYMIQSQAIIHNNSFSNLYFDRKAVFSMQINAKNIFSFIFTENPQNFSINSSYFLSNSQANNGSAINFLCTDSISINKIYFSLFYNNSAFYYGGSIMNENCYLELVSNEFRNNTANIGGGIYHSGKSIVNLSQNLFYNNQAMEGGAIKYTILKPLIDSSNIFHENHAFYGPSIASYPIRINLLEYLNTISMKEFNLSGRPTALESIFENLSFLLIDELNQTVCNLNDSFFKIELFQSSDYQSNNTLTIGGDNIIPINSGKIFLNNTFFSSNLTDDLMYFVLKCSVIQKTNENIIFSLNEHFTTDGVYYIKIPLLVKNCVLGEIFDQHLLTCLACVKGKYSLDPNDKSCNLCPNEAEFCISHFISLKNGFWRRNNETSNIYSCLPYGDSCLGGLNSACAMGYRGPLCQSCDVSDIIYSKYLGIMCLECSNNKAMIIMKLLLGTVFLIIFYIFVISSNIRLIDNLKIDEKSHRIKEECLEKFYPPIYNKILINYLQTISLIKNLDLNWPSVISDFFQAHYVLGNVPAYVYSFECLTSKNALIPAIYLQVIFVTITPIVGYLVLKLFWFIVSKRKKTSISNHYLTSSLVLFNLLLPTIVNVASKIITCVSVDGTYYISSDLFYQCYDAQNIFYAGLLAIPSVFFWILIYPLYNLTKLTTYKSILNTEEMRKKYGFLYNSYKTKYFYWEFVEIYKKFFMIIIISYSQVSDEGKALFILFFIYLCTYFLAKNFPYVTRDINKLAFIGELVSLSTLFVALFAFSISTDVIQMFAISIILLGNAFFLTLFILRMGVLYKKKLSHLMKYFPGFNEKLQRFINKFPSFARNPMRNDTYDGIQSLMHSPNGFIENLKPTKKYNSNISKSKFHNIETKVIVIK